MQKYNGDLRDEVIVVVEIDLNFSRIHTISISYGTENADE
jgi:hypothetical protein